MREPRSREIPQKDIDLIKATVARGCTDDELQLFLWVARKHKLDPMTRQLHAVKRNNDGESVMTLQIGIDGYRSMAARYPDYGGIDEPEYEYANSGDVQPTMARVRVWKKGFDRPTVGIAFWSEYAPPASSKGGFMWRKMPRLMLAKCAEALALRKAYPDLADIYTDEEMHQADVDHAPSGRQIINQDGFAPSGRAVTWEAKQEQRAAAPNPEEDAAITNLKAKNLWCEEHRCTRSSKHAQTCETTRKALEAILAPPKQAESQKPPIDVKPSPAPAAQHAAPTGLIITVDWTADKASPRVTGDIQDLACANKLAWGQDQFYHCLPFDVEDVRAACMAGGIEFKEIMAELAPPPPKKTRPSKQEAKQEVSSSPVKETGASKSAGGGVAGEHSAVPTTIRGIVGAYKEKTTKKGNPFLSVLISSNDVIVNGKKEVWLTSFNLDVNNFIKAAKGKIGTFIVEHLAEQWPGLIGLKELAGTTYTDGKIPDIQRSSQPTGGKTLFG